MSILVASAFVLVACIAIALLRAAIGPTIADRIVAVDTMGTIVVSVFIVLGAFYKQAFLIDIGIVYAMISFAGTLYLAHYLEGKK